MKRSVAFIILYCLLSSLKAQAQPKANFVADKTSGCAPIVVRFQNLSTGIDNATQYFWDLGNGATSTLKNPAASYLKPGIFRISLKVTTTAGKDSLVREGYISVYGKPQADLEADIRTGCSPTDIQFKDISVAANGTTNAKWNWDFGDGTGSTEQNPKHTYTTPGIYSITLNVTSDKGCSNLISKSDYINIVPGVKPQFTNTQQTVCNPPVKVNFTNTSTGPETLSYLWDFGNGQTSTRKNPSTTYNTAGAYPVKLVVRSSYGCTDSVTVTNAITISTTQLTTNFHIPPVCSNTQVQLLDSSSAGVVSRLWKFSDGTRDSVQNPIKTFTKTGTYTITLINNYGNCTDSVSKKLKIGPSPAVDFKAAPRNSCQLPFPVTFTNSTKNGASYQWSFGDGTFSTDTTPVHTYNGNGSFTVTLIAANAGGCTDTLTKTAYINIQQPVVYFKKLPENGCIPYTIQFADSVISADRIVSYKWDLGDGTTSTAKSPKHTYRKQGAYTISLTITTATGCTATGTIPNGVKVGTKPGNVDFNFDKALVCASEAIQFKDSSVNVDEWDWDFGDGTHSNEKDPSHLFNNIGPDTVRLTAYNSGCKAKVVKKVVTIKPPIAIFSYRLVACTDRLTFNFLNSSLTSGSPDVTYQWNFGDGTTSNLKDPPPHTYPAFGSYPVSLYVKDGDCDYNAAQTIVVAPHNTEFSAPQTGCKPFTTVFTPSDLSNSQIVAYTWNFGDGTTAVTGPTPASHIYGAAGEYDVSLITTDIYGCSDTSAVKAKYIQVNGPSAKFAGINTKGCKGLTTTFSDSSSTDGRNAIVSWQWNFGDSTQQAYTAPPFEHQYKNVGWFDVKLTVQDAAGCRDSITYLAYVKTSELKPDFTGVQKTCPGAPVQFTSTMNTPVYNSVWDFGNGMTSTALSPVTSFPDTGTYTIKLVVSDSLGCRDSIAKPYYTQVYYPKAGFTENNLTSYCIPFQAVFTNTSTWIDSAFWDLGVSTSTQLNPVSYYTKTGSYNIRLRVKSPGGCIDTLTKQLNIYDINDAKFTYGPSTFGCRPLVVDFEAFTEMKGRFIWDFGDGAVEDTTINKITHTFEEAGTFLPKIILMEPSGCVIALTGPAPITVNGAKLNFDIDKKLFCDSGLVTILDSSIAQGSSVSYNWDFGDGTTSTEAKPGTHYYNKPGVHPISLTVKTGEGCVDTLSNPGVRIVVTPQIHITGDSVVCVNAEVQSVGVFDKRDSSAITWTWQLPNGGTSSVQAPPPIRYSTPGTFNYRAIAATNYGCADTAYNTVVVHPRPIGVADFPSSVTIQAGFPVKLEGTYPPNIKSYTWRPAESLSCTNCPFPYAAPKVNTKYIVEYVDSNNCKNSAMIQVIVLCKDANVFVPNTFSPNGDGSNDVFYVRGRGLDRVKSLRIFDRWGEVVFEKKDFAVNDPSVGWDGRYKGGNPMVDVYVYQIEVFCGNGEVIRFDGNVALIK